MHLVGILLSPTWEHACYRLPCWAVFFLLVGLGLMADQNLARRLRGKHAEIKPAGLSRIQNWVCMIKRTRSFRKNPQTWVLSWSVCDMTEILKCSLPISLFSLTPCSFQHSTEFFVSLCSVLLNFSICQIKGFSFANAVDEKAAGICDGVSFLKASPQYCPLFSCFLYWRQLLKINLHAKWIENPCQSKSWFENFALLKSFWLDSRNNSVAV